jgi:hypothetical protein
MSALLPRLLGDLSPARRAEVKAVITQLNRSDLRHLTFCASAGSIPDENMKIHLARWLLRLI